MAPDKNDIHAWRGGEVLGLCERIRGLDLHSDGGLLVVSCSFQPVLLAESATRDGGQSMAFCRVLARVLNDQLRFPWDRRDHDSVQLEKESVPISWADGAALILTATAYTRVPWREKPHSQSGLHRCTLDGRIAYCRRMRARATLTA